MKHFKDRYFLVSLLTRITHDNMCTLELFPPYQCSNKFSKFWCHIYLITDNGTYIYRMDDLSQNGIYLNRKLISFLKGLSFIDNVKLSDVASKKPKKQYMVTRLLVEVDLK